MEKWHRSTKADKAPRVLGYAQTTRKPGRKLHQPYQDAQPTTEQKQAAANERLARVRARTLAQVRRARAVLLALVLFCGFASAQDVPRIIQQTPLGETNPECCAVAVSVRNLFPILFIGDPLPVSPGAFNYFGIQATGLPEDVTVRLILEETGDRPGDDGTSRRYEFYGTTYQLPGWPGLVNVMAWAPDRVNGEYRMRIRYAGRTSVPVIIRFVQIETGRANPARGLQ